MYPRLLPGLSLPARVWWLGVAFPLAVLAACSSQTSSPNSATGELFARGIEQITDLYIDPIPAQKLVLVGAKNLSKLDGRLSASFGGDVRDRSQFTLTYDGIPIANYQVLPDIDARTAGDIVAGLIAAAKKASDRVAATPKDAIDKAVFDGMAGALDRFSRYASPDDARDQRANRDGFGGIGVTLETANNDYSITAVSEASPAERAGIRAGDKIVAINGSPVAGRPASDIIHQLRGPIGTIVGLTIERPGSPPREFKVERALVVVPTVTTTRDGNIAIFRVASFNHSTTQRLTEALNEAQRQASGRLGGIVLDLRGNPGGLLDQAVSLSDLFIAKGPIIATVGRHPASHQYFAASGHSIAPSTPLVVLINGGSASASEIVAAALQDVGRAVVVGSSSYGKGSVQTVMRLPNDGELTLTWARLVTPSGYYLQQHGVVPTLCTAALGDSDSALDTALRRPGDGESSRPRISLDDTTWTALRRTCPALSTSPAADIKVAERVLSDPARYSAALGAIHASANSSQAPQSPPGAAALTAGGSGLSSRPRTP